MNKKVLVTGGTGYIGSHTVVQLLAANYSVVIFDNLCNSSREVLNRIELLSGKKVDFVEGDIRNRDVLQTTFQLHAIDSVIHFAGLKAVGESQAQPLQYYDNNVNGSVILLEEMAKANINAEPTKMCLGWATVILLSFSRDFCNAFLSKWLMCLSLGSGIKLKITGMATIERKNNRIIMIPATTPNSSNIWLPVK